LTDLSGRFRNADQRRRVQAVVHDRLADDREPQECRYLMRFWWQLSMSYGEVTMEQLAVNVGESKLAVLKDLIRAARTSHAEIDAWITATRQAFPVIEDRGFSAYRDGADRP
jgi:hypothetical protein